jgi:hypothetical protein
MASPPAAWGRRLEQRQSHLNQCFAYITPISAHLIKNELRGAAAVSAGENHGLGCLPLPQALPPLHVIAAALLLPLQAATGTERGRGGGGVKRIAAEAEGKATRAGQQQALAAAVLTSTNRRLPSTSSSRAAQAVNLVMGSPAARLSFPMVRWLAWRTGGRQFVAAGGAGVVSSGATFWQGSLLACLSGVHCLPGSASKAVAGGP